MHVIASFHEFLFAYRYKMKHNQYHTVGTVPKSNIKTTEGGKIDTFVTVAYKYMTAHIHGLVHGPKARCFEIHSN
jgi:hypothetical protein